MYPPIQETIKNRSHSVPDGELDQTRSDRCTYPKWDKSEGVPLEKPDDDRDLPSGTILEDIGDVDLEELPERQPPSWDELL